MGVWGLGFGVRARMPNAETGRSALPPTWSVSPPEHGGPTPFQRPAVSHCRPTTGQCRLTKSFCRFTMEHCRLTKGLCRLTKDLCSLTRGFCRLTTGFCCLTKWFCRLTTDSCRLTLEHCSAATSSCRADSPRPPASKRRARRFYADGRSAAATHGRSVSRSSVPSSRVPGFGDEAEPGRQVRESGFGSQRTDANPRPTPPTSWPSSAFSAASAVNLSWRLRVCA